MIVVSKARAAVYHFRSYLFNYMGIPKVKREQISKSYIGKFLPASPVVIDCGAYDGTDTLELANVLKGKVYAFEAMPAIFQSLKKNTAANSSIQCFQLALSNITGRQDFHVSEGRSNASSSLLEPKEHLNDHPDTFFTKTIEVETITLDDWAAKNDIQRVDLLWLDMQGFELKMLQASPRILATVSAIHSEVSVKETYSGVALYNEYRKFLEENGFRVEVEAIPQGWDMGNVLFVRKK